MQATQRSTASEWTSSAKQFAALHELSQQMGIGETPVQRESIKVDLAEDAHLGVAEGAGLAHDAGNLLGALSLYSDLLEMPGVLHEEHRQYAAELRLLSDRSWAMIDRLLNHARTGQRPNFDTTVLPDTLDRCRGLLCRIAGRTVDVSYGPGAFMPVSVPGEAVERIVTNLVKNAAEATPWLGAISVHVEGSSGAVQSPNGNQHRVRMTVRDHGCGMDAAAVERLIQGRGDSSRKGRGLGFRVVRELVASSGGYLNIESRPAVGTSISMEWCGARTPERGMARSAAENGK